MACLIMAACAGMVACESTTDAEVEREWQATLVAEAGFPQVTGSAVVTSVPGSGQFTAAVELTGDMVGALRPWHVHFNSCAEGGGIVGADGDYPRLDVGATGEATASVTVNQSLQPGAAYHVNVHLADENLAVIVACGDLVLVN